MRPDNLGYLRRGDLEKEMGLTAHNHTQIWEKPDGQFYPLNFPYAMRCWCPVCVTRSARMTASEILFRRSGRDY
ncbi:MAG: hypothetical protein ACREQ5_02755 [Candidatus Dormibacteria bacterium]